MAPVPVVLSFLAGAAFGVGVVQRLSRRSDPQRAGDTDRSDITSPAGITATPTSPRDVTGIGGFFFSATDPDHLSAWYAEHLDVLAPPTSYEAPVWCQEAGPTVFAPFGVDDSNPHLGPSGWGLNLRVRDLDAVVRRLREAGHDVEIDPEIYPNGRFAQLQDPEGNPVQLWESREP